MSAYYSVVSQQQCYNKIIALQLLEDNTENDTFLVL